MIDVSVIIVSWNAKRYLLNCLQTLFVNKHEYRQEIIVVDNASTDGSADAINKRFSFVKLIRNKNNLGFAKANNIGINASAGRYICLINSDVIVRNECIERLLYYMDKHLEIGILGPMILNGDLSLQPSRMYFPTLARSFREALGLHLILSFAGSSSNRELYENKRNAQAVDALSGCFLMVRQAAFQQVGLLDESYFMYLEDLDWCKRFHEYGWNVVYYPKAEAIHFGAMSSSILPSRFFREQLRSRLLYWDKHHGKVKQKIIAAISLLRILVRIIRMAVLNVFGISIGATAYSYKSVHISGILFLIAYLFWNRE